MLLLACSLLFAQVEPTLSPVDAIGQAHTDLLRFPPDARADLRYLSLYNLAAAERAKAIQVLSGHCNGLSRESDLTPVGIVPGTVGGLVRVNLRDYRWSPSAWEQLLDPYFTTTIETDAITEWPGGIWPGDGKFYAARAFTVQQKKKVQALAPWLSETDDARKRLADVVAWTGSRIPVVRADWFFNQTAAAADRTPNYYDFLGIKDERTFQELIGFDAKKKRRKVELREAVADSGVTLQPRAIVRETAEEVGYWKSLDFRLPKGKGNPLRVLGRDIEEAFDASEQYGALANGLWATGLFDKEGKRQDVAPDFIASDGMSKSNDRRVHVNVSCIRCHTNGGLKDIDGWVRNLNRPPLDLKTPDYQRQRELRQQYSQRLEQMLVRDRAAYEDSIKEITGGMTSKEYAAAYAATWERYEDAKVDLAWAAADLGTTPGHLRKAIAARLKANAGDTVLSPLVLENPRLNRIPIRVWEEAFPEANLLLRGYVQP